MEIGFEKLHSELKEGKFRPVYLLAGEEEYFIDAITDFIENNAIPEAERSFNQIVLYGKDVNVDQIMAQANQFPMMGEKQVLIVKEAQNIRSLEKMKPYLERPSKTTLLLFAYKNKNLPKTGALYKVFKEHAAVMPSTQKREYELLKWFPGYLKEDFGLTIDRSALELLMEFQGTSIRKLVNEIQKINIKKDLTRITEEQIHQNIAFGKDFNVFEVQEALANRDKKTLTRIVSHFTSSFKAGDLIAINSILFGHFSLCYTVAHASRPNAEINSALGITDYRLKKIKNTVNKYGYKLDQVLSIIKEYELRSKGVNSSNASSPAELLKEMLFKIVTL